MQVCSKFVGEVIFEMVDKRSLEAVMFFFSELLLELKLFRTVRWGFMNISPNQADPRAPSHGLTELHPAHLNEPIVALPRRYRASTSTTSV